MITSAIGVIVTAAVGLVSWLSYRKLTANDRALVKLTLSERDDIPGSIKASITIENYSTSTWTEIVFEVTRPRRTRAATFWGVNTRKNQSKSPYGTFAEAFEALKSWQPIQLGGSILPAGSEGTMLFGHPRGPTDTAHRDVYIDRDGLRTGGRLDMRVTLISNDAKQRRLVTKVRRRVPAEAPKIVVNDNRDGDFIFKPKA